MNKEEYLSGLKKFLKQFVGKSTDELFKLLDKKSKAKSKNYIVANGLFSLYDGREIGKLKLAHFNIKIKTIQLNEKNNPKEAMSLPPIDFEKIVNEEREESTFYKYLNSVFLFFVFKKNKQDNELFRIIEWRIPPEDINGELKFVWEDTKTKLKNGTVIKKRQENDKIVTMFLNEKSTNICHIRPHGRDGGDIAKLPVVDNYTGYSCLVKQSFWFNHKYLKRILLEGSDC